MNKEQTLTGVIRGTGACVPKRVMDNDEIAGFVETSDEWIRERTGVERRHIAEEETTVSMAVEAGFFHVQPARYRRLLELWVPLDLISMLHAVDFFSLTIQRRRT